MDNRLGYTYVPESIREINLSNSSDLSNSWFTLDGLRIGEKPSRPGLYIHNGRKVLIK